MNVVRFIVQNHTQVLELTWEHLWLVGISTLLAMFIGIPLGILIAHRPRLNKPVLAGANVIQLSRALRYLDSCCQYPGSANDPIG